MILLIIGCIKNPIVSCMYPCQVSFHFTKHSDGGDALAKSIHTINLYIYSKSGELVNSYIILPSELRRGNYIVIDLPMGEYTAVAWGGVKELYAFNSLLNLSEASLSIKKGLNNTVINSDEHLYYANISDFVVTNSVQPFSHILDFEKNSKNIKTSVHLQETAQLSSAQSSANNISLSDIECVITASNGDYKFDNTIFGEDQITYIPNRTEIANELISDFFVLKLNEGDNSRLKVTINDPENASNTIIYNESLSELILLNQDIDFDFDHDIDIDIEIDPDPDPENPNPTVNITISVNGWEVVNIETEI